MTMSRLAALMGAVLAALGALTACGVTSEATPRALPIDSLDALRDPAPAVTTDAATRFVALWFVRDDDLVQVDRPAAGALSPQQRIDALGAGPTQEELDQGLRTAVTSVMPDSPLLISAAAADVAVETPSNQVAVVLESPFDNLPSQEQLLVLGQVVHTLASGPILSVAFVDPSGTPVGVPLPDGRLVNRPVTPQDYRSLVA